MESKAIMIVLRLVHILSGVFWVGAVLVLAGFLLPSLRATGPEGGRFVQHVMRQRRLQLYLSVAMVLTILSGVTMYVRFTNATDGAWAQSRPGMALGLGGALAIVAAAVGGAVGGRAGRRMARLGESMQAAGGPPTAEQSAEMGRLQARLGRMMRVVAALLVAAAAAMAIARYL